MRLLCLLAIATLPAAAVDFQREIAPIFAEYCFECHGPDKAKGGLNLATRDGAVKELKSGAFAVVTGKPDESELLARLLTHDADEMMPPKEKTKRPSAAEVEKLRQWIAAGAEWSPHWAYTPVRRPEVPATAVGAALNPVDAFIRARLAQEGIAPSPEADRFTLIKRLSYDLLGLPPTPAEADAFAADPAPEAYERLVDRLLASPHFGERWGRHWLDRARYADSDGYEKDSARPDAWRYRDWVIEAINADLPFDQFTIEQLAGDLLPDATPEQRLATAFHRQTLTNREGGVDQEQYRVEAVFDRTETTGAVWLGLTVGCARCHTHKYDQLSHAEYYRLFAFFNDGDETTSKVGTSAEALTKFEIENAAHLAQLKELEARLAKAREGLEATVPVWEREIHARLVALEGKKAVEQPADNLRVQSAGRVPFAKQPDGSWLAAGPQAKDDVYTLTVALPPGAISGLRLHVLPDASLPGNGPGRSERGNFVLHELRVATPDGKEVALHSAKADFEQGAFSAAAAIDGNAETGWAISPQFGKAHQLTVQFLQPLDAAQVPELRVVLEQKYPKGDHSLGHFRVAVLAGESEAGVASPEVRRLVGTGSDKWTEKDREVILDWLGDFDPAVRAASEALAKAAAAGSKPPLMDARVLGQRSKPRETRIFHRGEFLSPTDAVHPATPGILPPLQPRGPRADRLDLARWLVSKEHPLTARVAVNQVWQQLFGEGLVRTAGDFGVRGEKPTHPELLDWLAAEFIAPRSGKAWSRKQLIRLIVTSATYRQSSATRADLRDKDPQNRLLARQSRLRVEGEIVRDLHLAASGLLAPKIGGPSVFPAMPPEIAALSYAGNFKWKTSDGEDRYRRGLYTFFKRTAPHPDLITFDCPDANLACVDRMVSNTPLQALTTLNSRTFTDAALALARRALQESDDPARLTHAFRACLIRPPTPRETARLLALVQDARVFYQTQPAEAVKLAGEGPAAAEISAWMAATRVIMNTDEFITRE